MLTHISHKMNSHKSHSHKPHRHDAEQADDPEPGMLPVDPDEGPVPPVVPADAEHERIVDPEV